MYEIRTSFSRARGQAAFYVGYAEDLRRGFPNRSAYGRTGARSSSLAQNGARRTRSVASIYARTLVQLASGKIYISID